MFFIYQFTQRTHIYRNVYMKKSKTDSKAEDITPWTLARKDKTVGNEQDVKEK